MTPDRLKWNIENWQSWISAKSEEGDFSRRAGSGLGWHGAHDFDAMVDCANLASAEAVQAVLDGMVPRLRLTFYNRHLETVWELRGNPEANYAEAISILGSGLDRRGIY